MDLQIHALFDALRSKVASTL